MADETTTGLPASIEAAWGVRARPSRGPKPALTLERIVAGAIAVADAEGLDAVSMGRVAAEIGSSAMSLYRYVASKDELLTLMVDAAFPAPPTPDPDDWRAGLTEWAFSELRALFARPWSLRVPISGPPVTPNQLRWLESGLRSLSRTPLTGGQKMSVILLLTGYVRHTAQLVSDLSTDAVAEILPRYEGILRTLLDPAQFPELRRVVDDGTFSVEDDPSDEFVWGLDRILDGVGSLIETIPRSG